MGRRPVNGEGSYRCGYCGFVYDPAIGDASEDIAPGTPFEALPRDWICPECGAFKFDFKPLAR